MRLRRFVWSLFVSISWIGGSASQNEAFRVPNLWDARARIEKPDLSQLRAIRFLTDDDYPPFHYIGADGRLVGFNVDLARAICQELKLECTIQTRRWDLIPGAILKGEGDAAIASMAISLEARRRLDFTAPYYRTPARFAVRKDARSRVNEVPGLNGRIVAVVTGSAHEAFLKMFFKEMRLEPVTDFDAATRMLLRGGADAVFADGLALAFWLNGSVSQDCCRFLGGPYLESRFFGEGVGIALRLDDETGLKRALDYALQRLWDRGVYTDLYLKHFPIGYY